MKGILYTVFTILCMVRGYGAYAQEAELTSLEKHAIRTFVNDLQFERKELVAEAITYPILRNYPLPPIESKNEFLEHYDDFIDASLINTVQKSEWKRNGWGGICCGNGILWGYFDENGEFRVDFSYRLNQKGLDLWMAAVEAQRSKLYPELRDFKKPELMFKTRKYIIRIDVMEDDTFRYASWKSSSNVSSKPDLVLFNGTIMTGSLPTIDYFFTNGEYEYRIGDGIPSEGYDYELTVSKNNRDIMTQKGIILY